MIFSHQFGNRARIPLVDASRVATVSKHMRLQIGPYGAGNQPKPRSPDKFGESSSDA